MSFYTSSEVVAAEEALYRAHETGDGISEAEARFRALGDDDLAMAGHIEETIADIASQAKQRRETDEQYARQVNDLIEQMRAHTNHLRAEVRNGLGSTLASYVEMFEPLLSTSDVDVLRASATQMLVALAAIDGVVVRIGDHG